MYKDVMLRLTTAVKGDKTSKDVPAAMVAALQASGGEGKSIFTGNRATALQLARSVVPVVKGEAAETMADKIMVRDTYAVVILMGHGRMYGCMVASRGWESASSAAFVGLTLVLGAGASYASAGAAESGYQGAGYPWVVVAEPLRQGRAAAGI
jgi:hypothetical protein